MLLSHLYSRAKDFSEPIEGEFIASKDDVDLIVLALYKRDPL